MSKNKHPICFDDLLRDSSFDPEGLLSNVVADTNKTVIRDPKLRIAFQEVVDFRTKTGHAPRLDSSNFREKILAARLSTYRSNPSHASQVQDLDIHDLLTSITPPQVRGDSQINTSELSFEDILKSVDPLISELDPSIFKIKHIRPQSTESRNCPDEIASRKPCEDFYRFEKLFKDTQRAIANKKFTVERFKNENQVDVGDMFILSGLVCLVDSLLEDTRVESERINPRYRVIFENGIETNILKRSLARALYKDPNGRRIIPDTETLTLKMQGITHRDKPTGCIYILASETKAPALAELRAQGRLVKIGFSTQSVEERVKNAEHDPTYLEAPVKILASLDCYNLDPHKVEHLIHAFLVKQRLNMTLISSKGLPYHPTEWFAVDRDTAIAVAEHIVKGDIMDYRMDNTTNRIKKRCTGTRYDF